MDTSAMAIPFLERARRECPYVFEPGYQMDDASGLMRRERFIHFLQYGHSLLSAAVHNEGISTADIIGIEDSESMETEQGQNLCLQMCSRIYPGGLLYIMCPGSNAFGLLGIETIEVFVGNLLRFAEMIAVRCVIHLPVDGANFFERHPALQEAAQRLGFVKCLFPMSSFGCQTQSPTTLWGTDKFVIKGVKHVSARVMTMLLDWNLCMCPCTDGVRFSCLLMCQLVSGSPLCAIGE
ncbi:unnamed protein product [Symbiodinium sp. CCMP2592]|nr:unnamed protein product [Symbiodinium sp. CCMP2592]